MRVIAVTGGIATGKSSLCAALQALEPATVVFDADRSVAKLYADPQVQAAVTAAFGPAAFTTAGQPDRAFLRDRILAEPAARRQLEAILHPLVRRDCLASRQRAATSGLAPLFVADIPLLFESGFDYGHELVVVVATTPANQAHWLHRRNGFTDATIRSLVATQLPLTEKIRRAQVVVWNAGPPATLHRQAQRLLQSLTHA
jgi:dephospho-CoA kinase